MSQFPEPPLFQIALGSNSRALEERGQRVPGTGGSIVNTAAALDSHVVTARTTAAQKVELTFSDSLHFSYSLVLPDLRSGISSQKKVGPYTIPRFDPAVIAQV